MAAPWRCLLLCVGRPGRVLSRAGGTPPVAAGLFARSGGTARAAWARVVVPVAPAISAAAPRWAQVTDVGIIRVVAPDRVLAPVAPAEQPAFAAATLVGRLRKRLKDAVQAVQVGHQATAALRRLAAARHLAGTASVGAASVGATPVRSGPVRTPPVRTGPAGTGPVRTTSLSTTPVGCGPVGTAPPETAPPAVAAFVWFWLGCAVNDRARNDPAPARASLVIRIGRVLVGRPGREPAPRGLGRRAAPPRIPAGRCCRSAAPGTLRSA
jgi:hypothetical protein